MTPEQAAALKAVKDRAAAKALELYGAEVKKVCEEQGISLLDLAGDAHVHMALLVQGDGTPNYTVVRAQWTFHDNPVVAAEMLEQAKAKGLV